MFNNGGEVFFNAGELIDNTAASGEKAAEETEVPPEEAAAEEKPPEEAEAPAEEAAAGEEEAEKGEAPVEEAEPGETATEEEKEDPAAMLVVTAPVFEPLTVGYRREEIPQLSAAVENTGKESVTIRAARISGGSVYCFSLKAGKNVTIAPGETNDTAWVISPVHRLPVGEYSSQLILILEDGTKIEIPLTFTIEGRG